MPTRKKTHVPPESAGKAAFGYVIRRLREEQGLTQEQVAWAIAMSRVYISELERGLREPSLGTIIRLAHALKVSAAELIAAVEHALKS